MLQLYHALVHRVLLHGMIIWGTIQKLKSVQNGAIRAVVDAHFRDSVNPYYSG